MHACSRVSWLVAATTAALAVLVPRVAPAQNAFDAGAGDASSVDAAVPTETPPSADDRAAESAVGTEDADAPDPVAEEGERTGTAEGEPLPERPDVASEIAALSDRACLRALQRARVPFERVEHAVAGIAQPVRVTGPIGGVSYHASDRADVHELMDCRLAVALVRFSHLLRPLGVATVLHYSTYRPPGHDAIERHAFQTRHAGGLAIDAAWFVRDDGSRFGVERDFHGRRGRPVCGPDARVPHDEAARLLRSIACDAARRGLFHVILTPNWNVAHRNHFHMEVTRGVNWLYVH